MRVRRLQPHERRQTCQLRLHSASNSSDVAHCKGRGSHVGRGECSPTHEERAKGKKGLDAFQKCLQSPSFSYVCRPSAMFRWVVISNRAVCAALFVLDRHLGTLRELCVVIGDDGTSLYYRSACRRRAFYVLIFHSHAPQKPQTPSPPCAPNSRFSGGRCLIPSTIRPSLVQDFGRRYARYQIII